MRYLLALCLVSTSAFPMKMDLELLPGEGEPRCENIVKYAKGLTLMREAGIPWRDLGVVTPAYNFDETAIKRAVEKKKTVEDISQACLMRGPDQFVDALK